MGRRGELLVRGRPEGARSWCSRDDMRGGLGPREPAPAHTRIGQPPAAPALTNIRTRSCKANANATSIIPVIVTLLVYKKHSCFYDSFDMKTIV